MHGHVVYVNISRGGVPKNSVPSACVRFERVEGDDWNDKKHHGLPGQAICLYSLEHIEELKTEGFPLFPGALGENFTTAGLTYRDLRPGQVFRVGTDVEIRITKVRQPCRTILVYGDGIMKAMYDAEVRSGNVQSLRWGRSGFYAEVLREGTVHSGDPIIQKEEP